MIRKGGSAGMLSGLESLGLDGMISSSQNIDNEIEVSVQRLSSKRWLKIWDSIFLIQMRMSFLPGTCIRLHLYK